MPLDVPARDSTAYVVYGYLRNLDRGEQEAQELKLRRRFAVIIGKACRRTQHFDSDLLLQLVRGLLRLIAHDAVSFRLDGAGRQVIESLAGLEKLYQAVEPQDHQPFVSAMVSKGGRSVCYIRIRRDGESAGPGPCSYEMSLYAQNPFGELFSRTCREILHPLDVKLTEMQGEFEPHLSLWQRIKDKLAR